MPSKSIKRLNVVRIAASVATMLPMVGCGIVKLNTPVCLAAVLVLLVGCSRAPKNPSTDVDSPQRRRPTEVLRLATTTRVRDSGLLETRLPLFEREHGCRIDVIAVGTGAALKLGEAGDVDVVLVHSRPVEESFMQANHGIRHEEFMYNHFVLLGPANDPAAIRDIDPIEALRTIAAGRHAFISRGDDSGTHRREQSLWEAAGVQPQWDGYVESGQGMGPTLMMADEKQAYVLADEGTYLNFSDKIELVSLAAASESLRNPYAAIVVNPDKHERINASLARAFVDFLIAPETQRRIQGYHVGGEPLFHPTRLHDRR